MGLDHPTPRKRSAKAQGATHFLNLFAYSGGATLAGAKGGANCCHVDASKGMVQWARENAKLNGLEDHPIRWIVDDVNKFLQREIRRGRRYDGVLLDPPSFGRGKGGELYKIEHAMMETLQLVKGVLSERPSFVYLTSHTPASPHRTGKPPAPTPPKGPSRARRNAAHRRRRRLPRAQRDLGPLARLNTKQQR